MAKEQAPAGRAKVRRREKKNITSGVAHVSASFNNTMITITDAQGNTIAWSSSGTMGFKGSRKSTPYAAQVAAEDAGKKAMEHGMKVLEVEVMRSGLGSRVCAARAAGGRLPDHLDPRRHLHSRTTAAARASAAACNEICSRAGIRVAFAAAMRSSLNAGCPSCAAIGAATR